MRFRNCSLVLALLAVPSLADEHDRRLQEAIVLGIIAGQLATDWGTEEFCTESSVPPACPGPGPTATWSSPEKIGPPGPESTGSLEMVVLGISIKDPGHGFSAECRANEQLRRECDVSYLESGAPLPLLDGRFEVRVTWETAVGDTGTASVLPYGDTGFFWFFDVNKIELTLTMTNACTLAGFESFWVFASGSTNVGVEITVTDTVTGEVNVYFSPQGSAFLPILDTLAFLCGGSG